MKDPDEIASGWCGYFTKFTNDSSFDEEFRECIDEKINSMISSDASAKSKVPSILTGNLSHGKLAAAIKSLQRYKAPCRDNITYEHIINGGELLQQCLSKLLIAF